MGSMTGNVFVNCTALTFNVPQAGSVTAGSGNYVGGAGGASSGNCSIVEMPNGAGTLNANATVLGITGGDIAGSVMGTGGLGGSATAITLASGISAVPVSANSSATAGNGGQGAGASFFSGAGGAAIASATAVNPLGPATAIASAFGGSPGAVVGGAIAGSAGGATANAVATGAILPSYISQTFSPITAFATARGLLSTANATAQQVGSESDPFPVQADATAAANSGIALATAHVDGTDNIVFAASSATSAVDGTAHSEAQAAVAIVVSPTFASLASKQAASYLIGNPVSTIVTAAWSSDVNVSRAFRTTAGNVNAIAVSVLQVPSDASGASHTYSSAVDLNLAAASLSTGSLILGATANEELGAGLDDGGNIRFRIQRAGVTLIDQTFTTTSTFQTYFQNTAFDLGIQNANLAGGNLDVQVLFDLTVSFPGDGLGTQLLIGAAPLQAQPTWKNATGGSWTNPLNWQQNTLPNGPGAQAIFAAAIASPQTVTLDAPTIVGTLQFNSTTSYTLASGSNGTLLLDNAGAPANISVSTGNHTISVPITLTTAGTTFNIAANSTLSLTASLSGGSITKTSPGKLILSANSLLTNLTITAGTIDTTNSQLIIEPTNKSATLSSLQAAIANHSLLSSTLPPHIGLAIIDNATLTTPFTTLGNLPADAGSILIAPELLGDANIDGKVDLTDLNIVLNNLGTTQSTWIQGNFDGAATIDLTDLNDVLNNLGTSFANPSGAPTTSAPEPASLLIFAAGFLLFLRRR
jgi:hypothetical protein